MGSSNATASAFGWDFQANLGLYLVMDEDLTKVERFKIEGDTEDIEIYFRSAVKRKPLFIQAKSQEDHLSGSTTTEHLTNAINSLLRATVEIKDDYSEMIYGTNIEVPIRANIYPRYFEGKRRKAKYTELPEQFKRKIDQIIEISNISEDSKNFFKEKLTILKISFYGQDDEGRYGVVKEKVINKLSSLGIDRHKCNRIFDYLQKEFIQNASKRIIYDIETLGLTIILLSIESDENQSFEKLNIPEEHISRIKREFADYISNKQFEFQFITQLVGNYKKYALSSSNVPQFQKIQNYILNYFRSYTDNFLQKTNSVSEELIDSIIKVTLYRILANRVEIDNIRERMDL